MRRLARKDPVSLVPLVLFLSVVCASAKDAQGGKEIPQTNLLFIMADDLRPELSIFGKSHMITPNFERLAKRSVVFDLCLTQVAVCNPSRDSLLTGLRPDTMGNYAFQTTYFPNPVFMQHLLSAGYKTAGYGKLRHWDGKDPSVWSHENYEGDWYTYQNWEWDHMNSTVMPDKVRDEKTFPDHVFTTKAINNLRHFHSLNQPFHMTALGFKMPHTALHVPFKYWDLYKNRRRVWESLEEAARTYPKTSPPVSWRCCADGSFKFMNDEGAQRFKDTEELEDMNHVVSVNMYAEMMQGYSAAITFIDKQLGRVLDVMDELDLWKNTTVILTADHGMHNGEKGLWEKWTLFDEATRVPLIIAHPLSPFKGQHYKEPVELVDVFPTLFDLTNAPINRKTLLGAGLDAHKKGSDHQAKLVQPGGKSLAPVVLGRGFSLQPWSLTSREKHQGGAHAGGGAGSLQEGGESGEMPTLAHTFGLSQTWKCSVKAMSHLDVRNFAHMRRQKLWYDCDINNRTESETSIMGYSMRTSSWRYTAWVHWDRSYLFPRWDQPLFAEELYDHRGEKLGSLTHYETQNLAKSKDFTDVLASHRDLLLNFLQTKMVYRNGHKQKTHANVGGGGGKGSGKKLKPSAKSEGFTRRRLISTEIFPSPPEHAIVREGWWD